MTRVFDAHNDVLSQLLEQPIESFKSGREGDGRHYDLPRLEAGGVSVMVCALFTEDNAGGASPVVRTLRMIDIAHRLEMLTDRRVEVACDAASIDRIVAAGRTAIVLSIENGIACLDRLELLRTYHRLGVRAMGLVWNGRNYIADGCGVEASSSKLTPFGRELVAEMERLGMVIDVSHLSESCFADLFERTTAPIIASHSNARALCDHARNLRLDQVRAIAARRGVIGLNFYPRFLVAGDDARATIDDIVRHAMWLVEHAGEDHVGIGADFDGIGAVPEGAADPRCFPALRERLAREGLTETQQDKLFFANFHRVFTEVMR